MKDADTKAPMAQTTPIQWLTVDEGHEGQRLDNYLLAMLRGVPKTRIYRMIRKGEVRVDGRRVTVGRRKRQEHQPGQDTSGSGPAGRSIRAPVAHGFMCTQDNYTSLHLIVAPC